MPEKPKVKNHLFAKLLEHLAPQESLLLVLLSIVVGAGTGLAAVVFIKLIALIQHLSYGQIFGLLPRLGDLWFIIIPVAGGLLSGPIIALFAKEAKGHGVPEVMEALILRGGRIRPRVAVAKIVASALCIGSGGSAGREGPIVQVGSTLGSSLGQWLNLSEARMRNLVACGAAAGIAATFNAPIAGIAFALEILLSEMQVAVFGNVVIASVSASIISRHFLGAKPAFFVPAYTMQSSWEILLYILLGLLAALAGVFFIRLLDKTETFFDDLPLSPSFKPAIGALLMGLLAVAYPYLLSSTSALPESSRLGLSVSDRMPQIFGAGFDSIALALQGDAPFALLLLFILLKPLATSFTLGSGNSGGVFAPSLFTGAMLGGAFGHTAQLLFPSLPIAVGAYALVGMASVFAAAARAPLTAILIVFEMSGDYMLILPLMTAGMIASFVAYRLYPDSIYTSKLSRKGIRFEQGRDIDILQGMTVDDVMNRSPVTVHKDQSLAQLFALVYASHLQSFPVIDEDQHLYGVISLRDMDRTLSNLDRNLQGEDIPLSEIRIGGVATRDPITVFPDEAISSAIRKMTPRDLVRLPVVARHAPGTLVGLISRSDILKAYQVEIVHRRQQYLMRERIAARLGKDLGFVTLIVGNKGAYTERSLANLPLPRSASVMEARRGTEKLILSDETIFQAGDRLTLLCRVRHKKELLRLFNGAEIAVEEESFGAGG